MILCHPLFACLNPGHTFVNSFIKLFSNCLILHSISCWNPKYKTRAAKNLFRFLSAMFMSSVNFPFLSSAPFPVGLLSLSQRGSWICKQSSYNLNNNNPLSVTFVENIFFKSVWPFNLYSWHLCERKVFIFDVNIFSFMSYMVSVTPAQLHLCSTYIARDNIAIIITAMSQ